MRPEVETRREGRHFIKGINGKGEGGKSWSVFLCAS